MKYRKVVSSGDLFLYVYFDGKETGVVENFGLSLSKVLVGRMDGSGAGVVGSSGREWCRCG